MVVSEEFWKRAPYSYLTFLRQNTLTVEAFSASVRLLQT
jgi:hypothetical protein